MNFKDDSNKLIIFISYKLIFTERKDEVMKKKVIVFGAGGSIGTKIVFDLIQKGY